MVRKKSMAVDHVRVQLSLCCHIPPGTEESKNLKFILDFLGLYKVVFVKIKEWNIFFNQSVSLIYKFLVIWFIHHHLNPCLGPCKS